jgi:hypothetical protein
VHFLQGTQITGNAIIAKVATQDSVQIDHLFSNRQMTHSPHEVTQPSETALKPRLLCPQTHLEMPFLVLRAIEGKTQSNHSDPTHLKL